MRASRTANHAPRNQSSTSKLDRMRPETLLAYEDKMSRCPRSDALSPLPLARLARYTPPNKDTRMYFGVDYYPEHWVYPYAGTPAAPESRWERDVELMIEAGVNVVRMGEFAW